MKMKSRTLAKKRIKQIEAVLSNSTTKANKDSFLEKYMKCEVACKLIIVEYEISKRKPISYDEVKMHFQVIVAACRHVGLSISDDILRRLFSSSDKRGHCSAKTLRNAIVHSLSTNDIKEVNSRFTTLNSDMDAFLRSL